MHTKSYTLGRFNFPKSTIGLGVLVTLPSFLLFLCLFVGRCGSSLGSLGAWLKLGRLFGEDLPFASRWETASELRPSLASRRLGGCTARPELALFDTDPMREPSVSAIVRVPAGLTVRVGRVPACVDCVRSIDAFSVVCQRERNPCIGARTCRWNNLSLLPAPRSHKSLSLSRRRFPTERFALTSTAARTRLKFSGLIRAERAHFLHLRLLSIVNVRASAFLCEEAGTAFFAAA
jgi:hypothetical protein